jgi:hypothetical protein
MRLAESISDCDCAAVRVEVATGASVLPLPLPMTGCGVACNLEGEHSVDGDSDIVEKLVHVNLLFDTAGPH